MQKTMAKTYSQWMEDLLCCGIFERIGAKNHWCFEAGAADGTWLSNTALFYDAGWTTVLVEQSKKSFEKLKINRPNAIAFNEAVPSTGLDAILKKAKAPLDIDLLSLDVDGQEYHIWENTVEYRPRLVVIEWSPYVDDNHIPQINTDGNEGKNQAALRPMLRMARNKGYVVTAITPTNLLCVQQELIPERLKYWKGEFPIV